jgi:hypothetical protein
LVLFSGFVCLVFGVRLVLSYYISAWGGSAALLALTHL